MLAFVCCSQTSEGLAHLLETARGLLCDRESLADRQATPQGSCTLCICKRWPNIDDNVWQKWTGWNHHHHVNYKMNVKNVYQKDKLCHQMAPALHELPFAISEKVYWDSGLCCALLRLCVWSSLWQLTTAVVTKASFTFLGMGVTTIILVAARPDPSIWRWLLPLTAQKKKKNSHTH